MRTSSNLAIAITLVLLPFCRAQANAYAANDHEAFGYTGFHFFNAEVKHDQLQSQISVIRSKDVGDVDIANDWSNTNPRYTLNPEHVHTVIDQVGRK